MAGSSTGRTVANSSLRTWLQDGHCKVSLRISDLQLGQDRMETLMPDGHPSEAVSQLA